MALRLRYSSAMNTSEVILPAPAIDGPWRVDSYGAKIVPARNGEGIEELKLIGYSSMALYGSFADPSLLAMLRYSLSQVEDQKDSVVPLVLNRFGLLSDLRKYPESSTDLESALRKLIEYGREYEALLRQAKLIWSPNGKYLLTVIPLSSEELSDPVLRGLLGELLDLSKTTPLRPLLIAENPRRMVLEFQKDLSWQCFIGSDQIGYARDRYTMESIPGMASRIAVGLSVDLTRDQQRVLNSLSYEPTVEALNHREAVANEAASYESFLEGLTDGR